MTTNTVRAKTVRARTVRPRTVRARRRPTSAGWGLLAPFLVLYLLFLIGPTLYGFVISLFDVSLVRSGLSHFVGLSNYLEAVRTVAFWQSMWHTVLFTLLTTPPLVLVALGLAVLTDRLRRLRWFYRLVFFAPYVVPVAVATLIWTWLYTPQLGLYGKWLSTVGITPPNWLGDPNWAMLSVVIMTVWWTLGFNFVLYLAGLQDIPRDLYEASSVDGASPWTQLTRITVPLLRRTTILVTVLQILASLKIFDQIYLITSGSGGPNQAIRPALEYVYDLGFTDYRVGYASAASMLLFLLTLAVSLAWLLLVRRSGEEGV
ncbi:MAG: multiple sugar transport system permease protein [Micromonosporaceae bacterium]